MPTRKVEGLWGEETVPKARYAAHPRPPTRWREGLFPGTTPECLGMWVRGLPEGSGTGTGKGTQHLGRSGEGSRSEGTSVGTYRCISRQLTLGVTEHLTGANVNVLSYKKRKMHVSFVN